MTDPARNRLVMRVLVSLSVTVAVLAALVPLDLDPEAALQNAVADAIAASTDDRLLEVALEPYPERTPAIAITYGHLDLFRKQLVRFGPRGVPIVAAHQDSLATADALQMPGHAWEAVRKQLGGNPREGDLAPLTPEERGLIALLNMGDEGNAFVGSGRSRRPARPDGSRAGSSPWPDRNS